MKNLWNDDITQSIASTVSDVLEGKVKKEDVGKYIKSNSTGGFDVVDAKENIVKSFGKRDEAEGYAVKNLARLQEVEEPYLSKFLISLTLYLQYLKVFLLNNR